MAFYRSVQSMVFQKGVGVEQKPGDAVPNSRRKFLGTRSALALVACGVVLFPMLGGKTIDPYRAMVFWLLSPILVIGGLWGYAWHYLKLARRGAVRRAWAEAAHDFVADTRYITVLLAIAYLVGFFFDPNPR